METPVTGIMSSVMVMVEEPETVLSAVDVAVIVTTPVVKGVTIPFDTVAILVLLEDQVTPLGAPLGKTDAERVKVEPMFSEAVLGLTLMEVGSTAEAAHRFCVASLVSP